MEVCIAAQLFYLWSAVSPKLFKMQVQSNKQEGSYELRTQATDTDMPIS